MNFFNNFIGLFRISFLMKLIKMWKLHQLIDQVRIRICIACFFNLSAIQKVVDLLNVNLFFIHKNFVSYCFRFWYAVLFWRLTLCPCVLSFILHTQILSGLMFYPCELINYIRLFLACAFFNWGILTILSGQLLDG